MSGGATGRVNVQLDVETADALDDLLDWTGYTQADVVRRALRLYHRAERATRAGGGLLLEDATGDLERVIFL